MGEIKVSNGEHRDQCHQSGPKNRFFCKMTSSDVPKRKSCNFSFLFFLHRPKKAKDSTQSECLWHQDSHPSKIIYVVGAENCRIMASVRLVIWYVQGYPKLTRPNLPCQSLLGGRKKKYLGPSFWLVKFLAHFRGVWNKQQFYGNFEWCFLK